MAWKVGFEPTVPFGITGFQDQFLKPFGHFHIIGAADRIRTDMISLSRDFKSLVSTHSTTAAYFLDHVYIIYQALFNVKF